MEDQIILEKEMSCSFHKSVLNFVKGIPAVFNVLNATKVRNHDWHSSFFRLRRHRLRQTVNSAAAVGDMVDCQHDNLMLTKYLGKRLPRRFVALWITESGTDRRTVGDIGVEIARRE